jgi:hypothetical protein
MLGSQDSRADQPHAHVEHAVSLMTECANRFLAALDANQRGKATFPFDADERMNWHFIPKERKGLSLREMTPRGIVDRVGLDVLFAALCHLQGNVGPHVHGTKPL